MPVSRKGKVYLVGSGPGDYKLITLKGKECIEKAEVIIYDRLVNKRLLTYARHDAEIIYAGKSPERHVLKQHEINDLIVHKALEGKIITRLKGGDPFVFGRGGGGGEAVCEGPQLVRLVASAWLQSQLRLCRFDEIGLGRTGSALECGNA